MLKFHVILLKYSIFTGKNSRLFVTCHSLFEIIAILQLVKSLWRKHQLRKDENKVLSTALVLCLLPEDKIMEGCTYLLSITDNLSESYGSFALEIRKLFKNLEPVMSIYETAFERYDTTLEVCQKNFGYILKAQNPGDLLGKTSLNFQKKGLVG